MLAGLTLHGVEPLSFGVDEGDARRRGAASHARPAQFQRRAFFGGGGFEMDQRQGLSQAPGIGRCRHMAHHLAIYGELGAAVHLAVVVRNNAEELDLLLAFEFEERFFAAKISLVPGYGPTEVDLAGRVFLGGIGFLDHEPAIDTDQLDRRNGYRQKPERLTVVHEALPDLDHIVGAHEDLVSSLAGKPRA